MAKDKEVKETKTTEKKQKAKRPHAGRHGKKYYEAMSKVQLGKQYGLTEAFQLLPQVAFAKFDESVDVSFKLGIDPKHADQQVRGALVLPHGTGKSPRIAVLTKGDKARDAEAAGADIVGAEDLIEKISGGWLEFDKLIATPDMMVALSKVAKILGPRGLMPNPKLGTVTVDVSRAVKEQKLGKVDYRAEKTGIVQVLIGKKSFGAEKLQENFHIVAQAIMKAKPPTSKGVYVQGVTLSTTMSPGISLSTLEVSQGSSSDK